MPPRSASISRTIRHGSPAAVTTISAAVTRTGGGPATASPAASRRKSCSGTSAVPPPSPGVTNTRSGPDAGSASAVALGTRPKATPSAAAATGSETAASTWPRGPCPWHSVGAVQIAIASTAVVAAAPGQTRQPASHVPASPPHQAARATTYQGGSNHRAAPAAITQKATAATPLRPAPKKQPMQATLAAMIASDETSPRRMTTSWVMPPRVAGVIETERNPWLSCWGCVVGSLRIGGSAAVVPIAARKSRVAQSWLPAGTSAVSEISSSGGRRIVTSRSRIGTSMPQATAPTVHQPKRASRRPDPRTTTAIRPLWAGRGSVTLPPACPPTKSPETLFPPTLIPSSERPAGTVIVTSSRPWFSRSIMVSHSMLPESWHQQLVSSRQAQARAPAASAGGSRSAAAEPSAETVLAGGPYESSTTAASSESFAAGSSRSRRLRTSGRRPLLPRTDTTPPGRSAASTHASGTARASSRGTVRAARIVTAEVVAGRSSTSQDSAIPALVACSHSPAARPSAAAAAAEPPAGPRAPSDRAASVPPAGSTSDHSSPAPSGSEKWTTSVSSSPAAGRQVNVKDWESLSSRAMTATRTSASTGGRRRTNRARTDSLLPPARIRARGGDSPASVARRPVAGSSPMVPPGTSTTAVGPTRSSSSADPLASPGRRIMSISLLANSAPRGRPARCPAIRRPSGRPGVAATANPIRSSMFRGDRTTRQSSRRESPGVASDTARGRVQSTGSTESMNHPAATSATISNASPDTTRTSQLARPSTVPGEMSTVVIRAVSKIGSRSATTTRATAVAA